MIIHELKRAIADEVVAVDEGLRRLMHDDFQKGLQECIKVNRRHQPDVIKNPF